MKLYGFEFLEDYKPASTKGWKREPALPQIINHPENFIQKKPLIVSSQKSKRPEVLILGGDSVTHGWVVLQLQKRKIPFVSVNLDEFIFEGHFQIESDGSVRLEYGKQVVNMSSIKSVLFFAPQFLMGLDSHPEILTTEEKVLLSRWKVALHTLHESMSGAQWWPGSPAQLYESSQDKFSDLILANKLGLKVPDTLMTMNPKTAGQFAKKHKGKAIFREYAVRRIHKAGKLKTFKIEFVKPNGKSWKSILASPTVFQQFIEKKREYRAVVVSKKVFVSEINAESGSKSYMDWRYYETDKVEFLPGRIPKNVEAKLLKFVKARGLKIACVDLVEDQRGNFYFLEMNRPGSWLFIEALTGLPITGYLISCLARGNS
jgi:hypothetical protein